MKHSKKSKKQPLEFGTRLEIAWRDTTGNGSWHSLSDAMPEPPVVSQLGYFLGENKDTIYLAQGLPNMDGCSMCEGQVLGPTAIPRGCVVNIKRMK